MNIASANSTSVNLDVYIIVVERLCLVLHGVMLASNGKGTFFYTKETTNLLLLEVAPVLLRQHLESFKCIRVPHFCGLQSYRTDASMEVGFATHFQRQRREEYSLPASALCIYIDFNVCNEVMAIGSIMTFLSKQVEPRQLEDLCGAERLGRRISMLSGSQNSDSHLNP